MSDLVVPNAVPFKMCILFSLPALFALMQVFVNLGEKVDQWKKSIRNRLGTDADTGEMLQPSRHTRRAMEFRFGRSLSVIFWFSVAAAGITAVHALLVVLPGDWDGVVGYEMTVIVVSWLNFIVMLIVTTYFVYVLTKLYSLWRHANSNLQ